MIRLLLIVAIVAVGWYLYRRLIAGPARTGEQPPAAPAGKISPCDECGVHAPESDGVQFHGKFFCCPEHLQSWLKKNGPG